MVTTQARPKIEKAYSTSFSSDRLKKAFLNKSQEPVAY
jgi:hypothetical protein